MEYGVAIFPTDSSITPVELAIALEERGFESLWVAEHSHIPLSRASPWPGGDELPKMYYDVADPFVALAMAAAVTNTLKVATGIALVPQRDPIQLAKQVASLDTFSNGRFMFGVGGGWNAEEAADHGVKDFGTRWKLMREKIEAMKILWTETKPEYHGELVDFDPCMTWPKPAQSPHPPIHVGGGFPHAVKRAIRYGDGWLPVAGRDANVVALAADARAMVRDAGRDETAFEISVFYAQPDLGELELLADGGIDRAIFGLPPKPRDEILSTLDRLADLKKELG
jgi:probable F420-dependent oxidoreductase